MSFMRIAAILERSNPAMKYIMSLDQGTTSSRCILFDRAGNICS